MGWGQIPPLYPKHSTKTLSLKWEIDFKEFRNNDQRERVRIGKYYTREISSRFRKVSINTR